MKELSLNILDIAMNSVKAGATLIGIYIDETPNLMTVVISDNGCGMSEQTIRKLEDPFFTTRTTRKVGMGVPFYILAAKQAGGGVVIKSVEQPAENHGTTVTATFDPTNIDFTPLGDIVSTLTTLIHGYPNIDFDFRHTDKGKSVLLDTRQIKQQIGEIPINSFEILAWIKEYLDEQYEQ